MPRLTLFTEVSVRRSYPLPARILLCRISHRSARVIFSQVPDLGTVTDHRPRHDVPTQHLSKNVSHLFPLPQDRGDDPHEGSESDQLCCVLEDCESKRPHVSQASSGSIHHATTPAVL
jgi:hypothetical protein